MPESSEQDWWRIVESEPAEYVLSRFRKLLSVMPLTHKELADELGVDPSTVSRWSSGMKPSLDRMERAVEAIGRRLEELKEEQGDVGDLLEAVDQATGAHTRAHSSSGSEERGEAWEEKRAAIEELWRRVEQEGRAED